MTNAVTIGCLLGGALLIGYVIGATGNIPLVYAPVGVFEGGLIHGAAKAAAGCFNRLKECAA